MIYLSTQVGAGIKTMIDKGVVTRGDLFVTTKLWNTKHVPEDVRYDTIECI